MKVKVWLFLLLIIGFKTVAFQLTNVVSFTANLTFYLAKGPGGPTNQFRSDEMIYEALLVNGTNICNNYGLCAGTNIICYRILPSYAQFYDFKLFNDHGQEMPKTEKGIAYSQIAKLPKSEFDLRHNFNLHPIIAQDERAMFRPDEMFILTNKGTYEMEVKMRICVPMKNGLPDTNAMKDVQHFADYENFGIIESSPVRVTVMKE